MIRRMFLGQICDEELKKDFISINKVLFKLKTGLVFYLF